MPSEKNSSIKLNLFRLAIKGNPMKSAQIESERESNSKIPFGTNWIHPIKTVHDRLKKKTINTSASSFFLNQRKTNNKNFVRAFRLEVLVITFVIMFIITFSFDKKMRKDEAILYLKNLHQKMIKIAYNNEKLNKINWRFIPPFAQAKMKEYH